MFAGPEACAPDRWRETVPRLVAEASAAGSSGIIVDPENGWSAAPREEWTALADALNEASLRVRVGVTSFPSVRGIEELARVCGRNVWGSPQLYFDIETNRRGWERWRGMFGRRLIPSIAGYVAGPRTTEDVRRMRASPEGYRGYIDALPAAGGAIVWPVWPMPGYMRDALAARYGGARSLMLVPLAGLASLDTWGGLALALVGLLVLGALAGAIARKAR